jgi:hypothetical protein
MIYVSKRRAFICFKGEEKKKESKAGGKQKQRAEQTKQ